MKSKQSLSIIVTVVLLAISAAAFAFDSIVSDKTTTNTYSDKRDDSGHILINLWKDYAKASAADRPTVEAKVLASIKQKAIEERLAWDFWDASRKSINVSGRRNWKRVDSLRTALRAEVIAMNEPIVSLEYLKTFGSATSKDIMEFVNDNVAELKRSRNDAFYHESTGAMLGGRLVDYIKNDYEYALWCVIKTEAPNANGLHDNPVWQALNKEVDGRYPESEYLEYLSIEKITSESDDDYCNPSRKKALEEFSEKNKDRAISCYSDALLLDMKKDSMDRNHASSDQYKAFFSECKDYEKKRKSFNAESRSIVSNLLTADYIIRDLQESDIDISFSEDKLIVILKNLPSCDVVLSRSDTDSRAKDSSNKIIVKKSLVNNVGSFYVRDTLKVDIPTVDDGKYIAEAKSRKCKDSRLVEKHTLSIAARQNADGYGVYVADYKTGKPLTKANLVLVKNGMEVSEAKDVMLSGGFTALPENLAEKIIGVKDNFVLKAFTVEADGITRSSRELYLSRQIYRSGRSVQNRDFCNIYLDRGAYNPGDTVRFKAILYSGDPANAISAVGEGKSVKAVLTDSEGNDVTAIDLKTNDFGSVAGEFAIPTGLRNGWFSIAINYDNHSARTGLRVDEFVLPTYEAVFDKTEKLYLPGDTVVVAGTVSSYSGHPLSGASVSWQAVSKNNVIANGVLTPESNGAFSLSFPTDKSAEWQYVAVTVKIVDATGETHEYKTYQAIGKNLDIKLDLVNKDEASVEMSKEKMAVPFAYRQTGVMKGDTAQFLARVCNSGGNEVSANFVYSLRNCHDEMLSQGSGRSGDKLTFDMSDKPSGEYSLEVQTVSERGIPVASEKYVFFKLNHDDTALDGSVEYLFRAVSDNIDKGQDINVQIGTTTGPLWLAVEIYGSNRTLLDTKTVALSGEKGKDGSLVNMNIAYPEEYPDVLLFKAFGFRNGEVICWNHTFRRVRHSLDLPLTFTSFEDKTYPGREYVFGIKTAPGAECLAAIYDKSVDNIASNIWSTVSLNQLDVEQVYISSACGNGFADDGLIVIGYGNKGNRRLMKSSSNNLMIMEDAAVESKSASATSAPDYVSKNNTDDIVIRDNFASTLAFEPQLRSSEDGTLSLRFKTSDKLSTYHVRLYAHDKSMKNSFVERDMVVTLPVKVSVAEPEYLYAGDKYSVSVAVSSSDNSPLDGKLIVSQYDGADYRNLAPIRTTIHKVTVPANGALSDNFAVTVPSSLSEPKEIGLKVTFEGENFSDGVFVKIPVMPASQVLTEAHSAVLHADSDSDVLRKSLEKAFVNTSCRGAEYKDISIMDMLRDVLEQKFEPATDNVLDLSEAYYAGMMANSLGANVNVDDTLLDRILACRNADGGFGWFEGMRSTPVVTAVILERFAKLIKAGFADMVDLESSVKYLDDRQFEYKYPSWYGGITADQYLYVRSLYPRVEFAPSANDKEASSRLSEFRKYVRSYLTPGDERGLNGQIFSKARRLMTLICLVDSKEGIALANAWGVSISAGNKLAKSLQADVASLLEYAVDHKDGGVYYPNLVMPFRGLLESEAYAHSMMCDLLSAYSGKSYAVQNYASDASRISDGIRIWLMLQKETQKWDSEPAFVDAISSVLAGSEKVKKTRVVSLTKTYEVPFAQIRKAGNGFGIERRFFRVTGVSEEEITKGAVLHRGDKIRAEYRVKNAENRSFVVLRAPREAAFRPVQQLSGIYGIGIGPMRLAGGVAFHPCGYRNVKSGMTEFYFDSYPEEDTVISEEFFVTQEGTFSAPVVEIESLYAPHYRANGSIGARLIVR